MSNIINLTSEIMKNCAFRGGQLPTLSERQPPNSFYNVSTISFSIHNTTHIDLPWMIDWEAIKELIFQLNEVSINDNLDLNQLKRIKELNTFFNELGIDDNYLEVFINELKFNRSEIENLYFSWIEKDCIILDFSEKSKIIEKFLNKKTPVPSSFLKDDMTELEIFSLFNQLKITKEDIIDKLNKIYKSQPFDLTNNIIIFKTLWSEKYLPYKMDINNPIFEGWHAFLTYPFLSKDSVKFLIDQNVSGVGSDSPSLENPFSYIDGLSDNYRGYLQKLGNKNIEISPLHLLFLSKKKIIIENICKLNEIQKNNGKIYISPFKLGTSDGTIVNVYFKELD